MGLPQWWINRRQRYQRDSSVGEWVLLNGARKREGENDRRTHYVEMSENTQLLHLYHLYRRNGVWDGERHTERLDGMRNKKNNDHNLTCQDNIRGLLKHISATLLDKMSVFYQECYSIRLASLLWINEGWKQHCRTKVFASPWSNKKTQIGLSHYGQTSQGNVFKCWLEF